MGTPRAGRTGGRGAELTVATVPTRLAARQITALRGKPRASFLLAVDDIRQRGCAAAGVRLTGAGLSAICRLDLYGAWRLLTVFEAADRCVLLLVAEHTRSENPYRLIYAALGISEPGGPRTKPACCVPKASRPSTLTSPPVWRKAWQNSPRRCPPQAKPATAVVEAWARD